MRPPARAGEKTRGIIEHGMDFRIAGHAKNVPFVEPDHRPGFPEHLVDRMRVFEEFDRERIEVQAGYLGHQTGLRYNVVAEQYLVSLFLDFVMESTDDKARFGRSCARPERPRRPDRR